MHLYDQDHIRNFYNDYGELETSRWDKSIIEKVKFQVHQHYLTKHIQPGDVVLELGAGTGMFTKEIIKNSKGLVVTDLSPVQLDLNKKRASDSGYLDSIQQWALVDICDLSPFDDQQFDKVVCYGGPLSYVFEKDTVALGEIKRVLKPNGIALLSVMNLWGSINQSMTSILTISKEDNDKIISTGNLHPSTFTDSSHHCHMYRSEEFIATLQESGFEIIALSASNCLSTRRAEDLEAMESDPDKWAYFMDLEISASKSPGMIDSGSHMIVVVRA
ncbi:MAG: class I SAM-dependent methyltransferase [Bacteroidia bacterium]|nr:class I SAM-dependent methyltransferase [Bacteroidia bacterium]